MDGKLCPGIQPPPPLLEIFTPLFQGKPSFNPEIFQPASPPIFGLNLKPPFRRGGGVLTMAAPSIMAVG